MISLPNIDATFGARLMAQDPDSCGPWLTSISETCAVVARHWQLEQVGPPVYGGVSIIVPVTVSGTHHAAAKLVSPLGNAQGEHTALEALAGHGTVKARAVDRERGALLLELLSGPTLADRVGRSDPLEAATVAGAVARNIASVHAPAHAPRLSDGTDQWIAQLHGQHSEARRTGSAVSDREFEAAIACATRLGKRRGDTLTHGDLSFSNIMRRSDGSWVAIDPSYLAGPRENEAHTVLRSALTSIVDAPHPAATMSDINRRFCRAADADEVFALEISHARFVASTYWEAQHQAGRRYVENLQDATRHAFRLIGG